MNKLAERLTEILKSKKISQNKFAKMIGFAQTTVNGWCTGSHEPSLDIVVKICKLLNESADYLLGLTD